jgi:glyoxylate/hydroxypyruvate reductase
MSSAQQPNRILLAISGWNPENWREAFHRAAPDRVFVTECDGDTDPTIKYAAVWKQPPGMLASLPNLKAIFSLGAGVDHIFQDSNLPDVPIVRMVSPDLTARMSEYILWQVLDHFRNGPLYREQQRNGIWREQRQLTASEISVGILGLGELGIDAAKKLRTLGFNINGWSRTAKSVPEITCYHDQHELDAFLGASDIVVVLLPLTEATRGIINKNFLNRMKLETPLGGPVLINAGRGGLQVEQDILDALDSGRLMAASLDVFEKEPLAPESPIWSHPRIMVTPHNAASSDPGALVWPIIEQIENFEKGLPLVNVVDRKAGY